jgi:hypothetical protein
MRTWLAALSLITGLFGLVTDTSAKVVKFEIVRIEPAFEGRVFGTVGTYDRIIARATVALSPTDPHNTIIVDLDRAPRNAQGLVEAMADVEILRPTNAANGNRRLLYDVVNRGNQRALTYLNDAPAGNDFSKAAAAGNGFLMNRGYTVVISGWQGDLGPRAAWKTISVPVVPNVTGFSREEFIFDHTRNPAVATLTYPAADLDPSKVRLTVRQRETDPRVTPADLGFTFEGPDKISIKRPAGFDAGAIYELVYTAKDPKVMGMGFAATRDIVSFLRRDAADATGTANPVAGRIDYAVSMGVSQSGRFLHDFLYLGFNEDEAGRSVFDGLIPHVAAGKRMFTNYRFAQPGRNMQEHGETLYPGTGFPFSYPVTTDPVTGRTDGWLARCLAAKNCPKIIQTDTDLEFYQSFGSLVATDTKGEPLAMPDNVRLYYLASLQHASTATTKSGMNPLCTYPTNPLYAGPVLRALVVALEGWTADGTAPPASRYPRERQELPGCAGLPLRRPRAPADAGRPRRHAAGEEDGLSGVRAEGRCRRQCRRRRSAADAGGAGRHPSRLERAQSRLRRGWTVRQLRIDAAVRQDARRAHQSQRPAAIARGALSDRRRPRGHHRKDGAATGAGPPAAGRRRQRLPAGDELDSCRYSSHPLPLVPAQAGTQGQERRILDARFRGHERRTGQSKCCRTSASPAAAPRSAPSDQPPG